MQSDIKKEPETSTIETTADQLMSHALANLQQILLANQAQAGYVNPMQLLQQTLGASASLPWLFPAQYQQMLLMQQQQQQQQQQNELEASNQANQQTNQFDQLSAEQSQILAALLQRQALVQLQQQQQLSLSNIKTETRIPTPSKSPEPESTRPRPPKKPLTPYMLFSKEHWHRVKAANSHLSTVTEIGAIIGSMWRDLAHEQKLVYNERFTRDKVRYDEEIRAYLRTNNLHPNDLVRSRLNRKRPINLPVGAVVPQIRAPSQQQGIAWNSQSIQQVLASIGLCATDETVQDINNAISKTTSEKDITNITKTPDWTWDPPEEKVLELTTNGRNGKTLNGEVMGSDTETEEEVEMELKKKVARLECQLAEQIRENESQKVELQFLKEQIAKKTEI